LQKSLLHVVLELICGDEPPMTLSYW